MSHTSTLTTCFPARACAAAVAMLCLLALPPPSQAKLGQPFEAYKAKIAKTWTQVAEDTSGPKTNYHFSLIVTPEQQSASPGYAAGLTITVQAGKITGQSIAFRAGSNQMVGAAMATAHGFAFAYEAIGKPMSKDKATAETEFKDFSTAVGQAFMGRLQSIRYPGFAGLVTVTTDPSGNLIVAATPAAATPGNTPGSTSKH